MSVAIADLEAVRSLLLGLRVPRAVNALGELPRPEVEWPILVTFDAPVERARCLEQFDDNWRDQHDALIYTQLAAGGWTRGALETVAESPSYQALQIAVRLPGDVEPRSQQGLERLLLEVKSRAEALGALLTEARYPLESAVVRADELRQLRDFFEANDDGCVNVRIDRSEGFPSQEVERLLVEIGFAARPGGLLVWSNDTGCIGDDPIMGATLETEARLALWFAVPRVADPLSVLDAMIAVAALVVGAVGGKIVNEQGEPLNVLAIRAQVANLIERMNAAHLVPGVTGLSLL